MRSHFDLFAEEPDAFRAIQNRPSRRSDCLVSDEQNRALRLPEIVLQVMLDAARVAHSARGDDDLRMRVIVDRPGVLRCDGRLQAREADGIDSLRKQLSGLCVKVAVHPLPEDIGRLDGKR